MFIPINISNMPILSLIITSDYIPTKKSNIFRQDKNYIKMNIGKIWI